MTERPWRCLVRRTRCLAGGGTVGEDEKGEENAKYIYRAQCTYEQGEQQPGSPGHSSPTASRRLAQHLRAAAATAESDLATSPHSPCLASKWWRSEARGHDVVEDRKKGGREAESEGGGGATGARWSVGKPPGFAIQAVEQMEVGGGGVDDQSVCFRSSLHEIGSGISRSSRRV